VISSFSIAISRSRPAGGVVVADIVLHGGWRARGTLGLFSQDEPTQQSAAVSRCSAINSRLNHCPVDVRLHFRMFPVGFSDVGRQYLAEEDRDWSKQIDLLRNLEADRIVLQCAMSSALSTELPAQFDRPTTIHPLGSGAPTTAPFDAGCL